MQIPERVTAVAAALAGHSSQLTSRAAVEAQAAVTMLRAGAFGLEPPHRLVRALQAFRSYGPAGAALAVACQRRPHATAIIDERGRLSFTELDERSGRLANALRARGLADGDSLGILCRNHRGMFEALFAAAKLGARTVLLNTDFGGPQLADVCQREQLRLLIHDAEFSAVAAAADLPLGSVLGWLDDANANANANADTDADAGSRSDRPTDLPSIDGLIAATPAAPLPRPARSQELVLLTSGTTGTPKGAAREFGTSLAIPGGYLSKIELRAERSVYVGVPVFHAWGLLSSVLALALADTLVLARRAEPAQVAQALAEHGCDALITAPILLSRLLGALDAEPQPLPQLRVVAVSGSALPAELAVRTRRLLGDVLHNLYGSTEVAYASIATPADLARAPGTVGRAPLGTTIKLLDAAGAPVPRGQTGRIFVGNSIQFGGYTGGGSKEQVAGLMATGDLGHFDADGLLFIDGRDDEMIVSGGENVFPAEIEDLLASHPQLSEAAVVPVEDAEFGQRLRAFVVRRANSAAGGNAELDAEAVRGYVREHLARYKVPREVIFLDELPRNPAGKVVKRDLPTDPPG